MKILIMKLIHSNLKKKIKNRQVITILKSLRRINQRKNLEMNLILQKKIKSKN